MVIQRIFCQTMQNLTGNLNTTVVGFGLSPISIWPETGPGSKTKYGTDLHSLFETPHPSFYFFKKNLSAGIITPVQRIFLICNASISIRLEL